MGSRIGLYVALSALAVVAIRQRGNRRKLNHPPSPMSLPFLGNLLAMPPGLEHLAFIKIGKDLESDIIYLELLGNSIVVLNSAEAALDLLEKRSAIYSDRFCPPMIKDPELLDWSTNMAILGYNDTWRHHRRMLNHWLNPHAVTQFNALQEHQARLMLRRLLPMSELRGPFENVKREFFFSMASSIFQLTYGYHISGPTDPFFVNMVEAMHNGMNAVMVTNFYVNLFPALKHLPDWVPGTGWKRTIRAWRAHKDDAVNAPYEWTRDQVDKGVAELSIVGALLQEHNLTAGLSIEERDDRVRELAMAVFAGGTDTTATMLVNLVAAMVSSPHIQTKAQQEIDMVLGPETLPTLSDRDRLPYVKNLIAELARWRPVAPTAIPHMSLQDDIYRGYNIQKGTIVMGNIWAISRDERFYPDPEVFNPDRFLDPNVPHVPEFGWGRRKCPGQHFGESSLFIAIASLLSMYRFSKETDELGREIEPIFEDATSSLVLAMKPFGFVFTPRSERHRQILQELA